MGGGNADCARDAGECKGLSPRGRGKRPVDFVVDPVRGSIPAWAGETGALTIAT